MSNKRTMLFSTTRKATAFALTAVLAMGVVPTAFAGTAVAAEDNGSAISIDASAIELTERNAQGIKYLSVSSVIDQISSQAEAPAMEDVAREAVKAAADRKAATVEKALKVAKNLKGIPYVYGGSTPSGFDCSGFTMYCYGKAGIKLTHNAQAQYYETKSVSTKKMKAGDLVFFGWSTDSITHVGIYVGNGKYIHSPRTGKTVCIDELSDRSNFIAATRPTA